MRTRIALVLALSATAWLSAQAQSSAPAREALADLPGVHLWFTDSGGSGAPVVFVHAATGSSRVWEHQRPVFALVSTAAGGFVAWDYALSFPHRLRSLVVANSIGGVQDTDYQEALQRLRTPNFLAMSIA